MNSIISTNQADTLAALQKSRLSALIEDKALFGRICEAAVALLTNEKLRECDESTILGALYKAVSLKCRLEPEFGEAYLIPRTMNGKKVCCFQLGYKFWRAQALESGAVSYLQAREVYDKDEFSYQYGTGGFIRHQPAENNGGEMLYFYAHAKLRDGSELFEVVTKQAAEKSRRNSESQYDWVGPKGQARRVYSETPKDIWAKNYAPMALRTPIKRLCAALPLTSQIEEGLRSDGTVSYLQKDGQLVTMSQVEVEKNADQPQDEAVLSAELAEKLADLTDQIAAMDERQTLEYWQQFKASELVKRKEFIILVVTGMCSKLSDVDALSAFWKGEIPATWKASPEIKSIFTERRLALETAAKNG